ncbi:metallophosphoesterase [Propioniciclava soli]|uniref:Metallophosphoesterase n=1 Tax=Propioniciclava soli TaxID=2775081 RepID=A0ABZ3C9Z7_9ACTN|nr:metallophosphoesterase [Propioniciclava soli]
MIGRLAAGVLGAGAACVAYGALIEAHDFRVRRYQVPVLPRGADPFTVLHVSDIHLVPSQARKRDFLRGLGGLEPDLVVTTGDNISSPQAVGPLMESLARLTDVPGVFVFGSNDYEGPRFKLPVGYLLGHSGRSLGDAGGEASDLPTDELRAAFESVGWVDVDNQRAQIEVAGRTVHVRGTGDAHHHRDDYPAVAGPATPGVLNLGVTHAPYRRILDAMTADGVELILAGHTHGGQVCVPGKGALVTNCDLPREHASGMFGHKVGNRTAQVHVSAGVGMSPFAPYRFACPPEATLLTLIPAPDPM